LNAAAAARGNAARRRLARSLLRRTTTRALTRGKPPPSPAPWCTANAFWRACCRWERCFLWHRASVKSGLKAFALLATGADIELTLLRARLALEDLGRMVGGFWRVLSLRAPAWRGGGDALA